MPHSLCVQSCIGIGCQPEDNFAIKLKGNVYIEEGDIFIQNKPDEQNTLNLNNFIYRDEVITQFDVVHNDIANIDNNIEAIVSNIEILFTCNIEHTHDEDITWLHSHSHSSNYDCIYSINKQIAINTSNVFDDETIGNLVVPALYVANSGNLRGIVCEDDIAAFSDARIKTNIYPVTNALNKVLALEGVTFNRTDIESNKTYLGLIAQQVEDIVPEVVSEVNNIKTISYPNLVALLIEAIKELHLQYAASASTNDSIL